MVCRVVGTSDSALMISSPKRVCYSFKSSITALEGLMKELDQIPLLELRDRFLSIIKDVAEKEHLDEKETRALLGLYERFNANFVERFLRECPISMDVKKEACSFLVFGYCSLENCYNSRFPLVDENDFLSVMNHWQKSCALRAYLKANYSEEITRDMIYLCGSNFFHLTFPCLDSNSSEIAHMLLNKATQSSGEVYFTMCGDWSIADAVLQQAQLLADHEIASRLFANLVSIGRLSTALDLLSKLCQFPKWGAGCEAFLNANTFMGQLGAMTLLKRLFERFPKEAYDTLILHEKHSLINNALKILSHLPGNLHVQHILIFLMQQGAQLLDYQIRDCDHVLACDSPLRSYLVCHHLIPAQFIDGSSIPCPIPETVLQLLKRNARRAHTDPNRVDFKFAHACHLAKKQMKRGGKSDSRFVQLYDQLVQHVPLLRTIQEVSREIRGKIKGTNDKKEIFLKLWNASFTMHHKENSYILDLRWSQIREAIIKSASTFFQNRFWQNHESERYVGHGTVCSTLVQMKASDSRLKAAGVLLQENTPPSCGGLMGLGWGKNHTEISSCKLHHSWFKLRLQGATSVLTNLFYATEESAKGASVEDLIDQIKSDLNKNDKTTMNILRLRVHLSPSDPRLIDLKANLPPSLLPAFEVPIKDANSMLASLKHSKIPIIFATFTQCTRSGEDSGLIQERLLPSGQLLGRDLQAIFTDEKEIDTVQKLSGEQVSVLPLGELCLAETLNMIRSESAQVSFNQFMKDVVLPMYGRLFPAHPIYYDGNSVRHEVQRPAYFQKDGARTDYTTYFNAAYEGQAPARWIHGVMHVLRTTLFASIIQKILDQQTDREYTLMAAAFHDSARQDDGKDCWDRASAARFREWLYQLGDLEEEELPAWYSVIANKDDPTSDIPTQVVHDADCLEILRCIPRASFDVKQLYIKSKVPHLKKFLDDVETFIRTTDTLKHKLYFEYKSIDPWKEIREIAKKFPQLARWL